MGWQIAIDGPASAGKSTIANALSKKLNFTYLDTGAMYRAITLKALNEKIDLSNENAYVFLDSTDITFKKEKIFLDGIDVTNEIRTVEVTENVSLVSSFKSVRTKLVEMQRKFASDNNIVMDGRDIGTVVLPNANLKIYLDATVEERAKRRRLERLEKNNLDIPLEKTIIEITERDYKDSNRKISPLKQADDAIRIDTTDLEINEVLEKVIELAIERGFNMEKEKDLLQKEEETTKVEPVQEEENKDSKSLDEKDTTIAEKSSTSTKLKNLQQVEGIVKEVTKARQKPNGTLTEEKVIFVFENGQEGILLLSDTTLEANESLFDHFIEDEKHTVVVKRTLPNNKVLVSTKLVEKRKELSKYEEIIKNHKTIHAKVVKIIPEGLLLKHDDFSCLLPSSQIDLKEEEFEKILNEELEVAPIRLDYTRIRLIVSHNVAKSIKYKANKEEFFKNIKIGDVIEGTIKSIKEYGAFVELEPGVEGLLHISEVAHNRVDINDCLAVGDKVAVQVIKIDNNQIGLSRKALIPDMWIEFSEKNKVGEIIDVTVSEINKSGVVVKINNELSGFIPKSEFAWEKVVYINDLVKIGDEIAVKIIEIDSSKRRIILSRKQCQENPWELLKLKQNDTVKGVVAVILKDGIKVKIDNVLGYASKRSLGNTSMTNYKVGDEIELVVRVFDKNEMKLILASQSQNDAFVGTSKGTDKEISKVLKEQKKMRNTFGDLADLDKWQE